MTSSRFTTSTKRKLPQSTKELPDTYADIPNLKDWYRTHADGSSVGYREFLKRIHRMGKPRSHINKRFVAEDKLEGTPRKPRKPSKALPRS